MAHDSSHKRRKQLAAASAAGLPAARRHIFLCADEDAEKCADRERLRTAWKHLKRRLKDTGLSDGGGVARTRTHCLRVCEGGPIAVVYPEGAWYGHCDPPVLDRIVQEHLIEGRLVDEYLIAARPLAPNDTTGD